MNTMLILSILWCILLVLICLVWLSRHGEINRSKQEVNVLLPDETGVAEVPGRGYPALSVLIAAKDEERVIEACIRSLLGQDYAEKTGKPYEIIIINDRSGDRTREIVEKLIADPATPQGRLRLLNITELKPGWFGKNNAMDEGRKLATGDWLVFSDADCRFLHPSALRVCVGFALQEKVDFLSVLPELERGSFWEQVVQPVAGAVMVYWFHPRKVNDPNKPNAYANGAFMAMPQTVYDRLGGHDLVKTEVNEDVHLARIAKEKGLKLFVTQQHGLYICRMYTGFRQIWRGWSRIFFGCFGTMRRLRISLIFLLTFSIFPWVSLLLSGCLAAAGVGSGTWLPAAWWLSVLTVLLQQSVIVRFYKLSRMSPIWAPTYILGSLLCAGMTINAMFRLAGVGHTHWRGTAYRGNKVVQ